VLTGVGHDVDETLMDLSAHTAMKTPTAVADFLVQHNLNFESKMLYLGEYLKKHTRQVLQIEKMELDKAEQILHWNANAKLKNEQQILKQIEGQIPQLVQRNLQQQKRLLGTFEQICKAFDPKTTLKRGFSITYKNGKVVKNMADIKSKDKIETHLQDGKFSAMVVD
jgi:exodeoxyribonuclease VII large subunit